jgi:hypothetical protein
MTVMLHAFQRWRVDRSFDRGLSAAATGRLRQHLACCLVCRGRYHRQLVAEAALPDGDRRAEARLWREIERVAAPVGESPRARPSWVTSLSLAVAAVTVVLVLGAVSRREGPVPRGTAEGAALPPSLHLFRTVGDRTEPVTGAIRAGDGLLFAYSNPGNTYSHLMVFALDDGGQVYWYYPPYQSAQEDPQAVPIEARRTGVELREVVRHPLRPGKLRLFALFVDRPASVKAVERALAVAAAGPVVAPEPLALPGVTVGQESWLLEVQP